jgi:hypothetical protein
MNRSEKYYNMRSKILLAAIFFLLSGHTLFALAGPAITSFSPAQGQVGTLVTITGTNLGSPTAFSIGGKTAIVISNTGTQLVGFVMPGAITGIISITAGGATANSTGTFTVTAPTFPTNQQGGPLLATQGTYYSEQGSSVALSADGNTAVVGAGNNGGGVGATYVFVRSNGTWTQQAQLIGTGETINYAMQGNAVAVSADGNTVMVGGSLDGTVTDGTSGSIWFFIRTGTTWTQQGTKMQGTGAVAGAVVSQGAAVALSGDGNTAIEGGPNDNTGAGAAWIFTRSNGQWTQLGSKLTVAGTGGFGGALAISTDGNTAVIASPGGQGGGYMYTRSGNSWTQQGSEIVVAGSAGLGGAVALSADGNTLLMGAPNENGAYAFARSGTTWSQQGAEFTFPDGSAYTGAEEGCSVALSADGNTAVIGGFGSGNYEGGTWVYTRSGNTFTNQGGLILGSGNGFTGAGYQGQSVALSANGITALVGAPENNTYTGLAFVLNGIVPSVKTSAATSIAPTTANINGYITTAALGATVNFQWGMDPNLVGATTTTAFSQGANPVAPNSYNLPFTVSLTGLTASTTYYFRINGTNINGTANGDILSFTTSAPPPPTSVITFNSPIYVYYGSTTTPVISSTDKTSPFNYISDNTGVVTITADGKFQAVGVGSTFISAYQFAPGTETIEGSALASFNVLPAPLTITANNQTIVWGQPAAPVTFTYTGFVNGDTQANLPTGALPTTTTPYITGNAAGNYFIFNGPTATSNGGNYNISYVNGTLTVTPLYQQPNVTTVAATAITATGATINGLVNPNGAATTVTMQYTTNDDDGLEDLITATLTTGPATLPGSSGNTNYAAVLTGLLPGTTYYFIITGANPEFSVTGNILTFTTPGAGISFPPLASVIYGSADVTPGATSDNTTIPITYTSSDLTVATITSSGNIHPQNVGTTTITASQTGSGLPSVMQTFTVTPAPLNVTANNQTSVYGSNAAALTVTYSAFVNGDTPASLTTAPAASTAANSSSPAGAYTITASGAVDPNYAIIYTAGTYTVTPAPLVITASNQTIVAGSAVPALTVTYNGFVNEDSQGSLTTQPVVTTTATTASEVGTYPITVSGAADPNYSITYVPGILTVTQPLVFGPLPAKTYGDPDFSPGATGVNVTYTSASTGVATIIAGQIHITGAGSSVITATSGGTSIPQTLVVDPAPLTVTGDNQTRAYATANPAFTATYTGFVYSDNASSLTTPPTIVTTAASTSNVGTYPIAASGAADPNYTITYASGVLTITPVPLTIAASNQTMVAGSAIPALTVTYNGFVNEDSQDNLTTQPVVTTTATTASEVGTYPITVSGAADPNYSITYVPGILTVTQPLVFGPLPAKTYGDPDFSPGATGVNVTYTSASTGVATIIAGQIHITGAGSSVITATSGGTSIPQTLVVNPAPLTITADNQTIAYAAANPAFTVTYTGFVYSDNASSLTTPPTIVTTATSTSNAGTYPITVSGAADPNYTITYTAGVLTVARATQTITFDPIPTQTVTNKYDLNGATASSGLPVTFKLSDATLVSLSGTTLTALLPGTETVTASQAGDDNYLPAADVQQTYAIQDTLAAEVVVYPVVSPNGDGIDDILHIAGIESYPENRLILINRNGVKIFEMTGYNNTTKVFDGHSSITGALQQQGTLLYILDYVVNGRYKHLTGFTVLRY